MNPGSSYPHNLELKATKAVAPQALSFRGFFFFPGAKAWRGPGQGILPIHFGMASDYGGLKASGMPPIISVQTVWSRRKRLCGDVRIWWFCFGYCSGACSVAWPPGGSTRQLRRRIKKRPGRSQPRSQEDVQSGGRGEGFQPECAKDECPTTFGPIITDTAIPIEKGKFALQPTFGLSFTTHNFSPNWRRISAEGDFKSFGMSLKFTYGLWNNLEVFAVIPYIHNWASNVQEPGPRGERAADFGGLGDINLTFKYRLVEETEAAPTVSAIFSPTFPSGHFRHLNPGRLGTDQLAEWLVYLHHGPQRVQVSETLYRLWQSLVQDGHRLHRQCGPLPSGRETATGAGRTRIHPGAESIPGIS